MFQVPGLAQYGVCLCFSDIGHWWHALDIDEIIAEYFRTMPKKRVVYRYQSYWRLNRTKSPFLKYKLPYKRRVSLQTPSSPCTESDRRTAVRLRRRTSCCRNWRLVQWDSLEAWEPVKHCRASVELLIRLGSVCFARFSTDLHPAKDTNLQGTFLQRGECQCQAEFSPESSTPLCRTVTP